MSILVHLLKYLQVQARRALPASRLGINDDKASFSSKLELEFIKILKINHRSQEKHVKTGNYHLSK